MKRVIAIVTVVMVTLFTCVSALAYTDEDLLSTFVNVDEFLFQLGDQYHYSWKYIRFESEEPVFIYRNSSTCYLITRSVNAEVERIVLDSFMNEQSRSTVILSQVYWTNPDDPTDEIYTTANHRPVIDGLPGTYTPDLLAANQVLGSWNQNSIVNGFKAFEEIYVPPEPSLRASFSVPAGYVAVFKASSGTALSGSATFGFKSYPINVSVSAFGNTGQGYGYLDSEPSGSLTFPTSNFTYFPWQKGNPRDALGQTYNGHFSLNLNPSSGQVCYIYNPLYNPNAKDGPLNPSISISVDGISHLRLYPLHNGVIDTGDGWGSSSDDGYENPYIGTIDPDNGSVSYEDGSGNAVIPEYGGTNIVPDVDASQSLGEAVKSILKEIVSAITGVFSLAYQAIISLVGLAGPFFGKLAALYSWLPAPVLTALTSAMTLAVTIGVIRAFL